MLSESHALMDAAYAAYAGAVWRLGGQLPAGPAPALVLEQGVGTRMRRARADRLCLECQEWYSLRGPSAQARYTGSCV